MSHEIISVSVKESLLKEINSLQEETGLGRSRIIREGLKLLVSDRKEKESLEGLVDCLLLVTHHDHNEYYITQYKHVFSSIIKTHIHAKMHMGCMDLFILEGDAKDVKGLFDALHGIKDIGHVKLILP